MIKLFNIYGIKETNSYLKTFSDHHILQYADFVDEFTKEKPILVVGTSNIEELYSFDYESDILEKNVFWCYSPEEYLNEFIKQFRGFLDMLHERLTKHIKYVNPTVFELNDFNGLIELCQDSIVIYQRDKMLYCYNNGEITIINLLEFYHFGLFDKDKYEELKKIGKFVNDSDSKIHNFFMNIFNKDDEFFVEKTIPYFISLDINNELFI